MAERDPAQLNAVEEVQIDEFVAAARKAKRKKMFAGLAGGIALIGAGYSAMDALVWSKQPTPPALRLTSARQARGL